MRRSVCIGRLLGVRVCLHPLFALLLVGAAAGGQAQAALLLFCILLTHEIAHFVVARAYGLEVKEVEFLPFGGVARIEGLAESEPGVEATVALAGPLNNFLLLAGGVWLARTGTVFGPLLDLFIEGNMGLALFNLLPALPLDGGRFARSLLAPAAGHARASRLLARTGQYTAVAMVVAGAGFLAAGYLVPNAFALGFFLFLAASRELAAVGWEGMQVAWRKGELLRRRRVLPVSEVMATADTPVREVMRHLTHQRYYRIRVVDRSLKTLGIVEEIDLIPALARGRGALTLADLLKP